MEEDLVNAISELSSTSASGPDDFPSILLLQCKKSLSVLLTMFWKKCIETSDIPKILKSAIITPQHKGGSRSIPANYRPISLTSHLMKTFEKVLRNSLVEFMDKKDLYNYSQHGFRKGCSCLSQLLAHHDYILHFLANGFNVDTVYLDFAKAFDKVDFNIVLEK